MIRIGQAKDRRANQHSGRRMALGTRPPLSEIPPPAWHLELPAERQQPLILRARSRTAPGWTDVRGASDERMREKRRLSSLCLARRAYPGPVGVYMKGRRHVQAGLRI